MTIVPMKLWRCYGGRGRLERPLSGIDWQGLVTALSLVLIIEGLLPFAVPARWREMARLVASLGDRQLRIMGLTSMMVGLVLLYWLRSAN